MRLLCPVLAVPKCGRYRPRCCPCFCFWVCPPMRWRSRKATQGQSLQLSEAIESVRRSHQLIIAALADKRAAEGELQAARGGFDPVLKTRGDITPIGAYPNGRFEIGVEQPTPLWGAQLFAGYRVSVGDFPDYDGKLVTNQYGEARAGLMVPLLRNGPPRSASRQPATRRSVSRNRRCIACRIATCRTQNGRNSLH